MEGKVLEAKAVARYVRLSPRRARQVVDLIRGKSIKEAGAILAIAPQRTARELAKVLHSAVANAEHNYELNADRLFVAKAYVDEGPVWKRTLPRAMGRANLKRKRTSHITVVVQEKGD